MNIWIMNHYLTSMFLQGGGRHYWMAEILKKDGYDPILFGCNTKGDSNETSYPQKGLWTEHETDIGVKLITIESTSYTGNGKSRIKNMIIFARNLVRAAKEYGAKYGKPDVVYASSVHPLTVIAGEKIAKYYGVPCIGEVRDLWPETLVAYGALKRNSLPAKLLYQGEKWMYKKADAMIFTMEGAPAYIQEHKWDKANGGPIDLKNVYHICNGIDVKQFDFNKENYIWPDEDLDSSEVFCAVYTGSIRRANNLGILLDAFEYLKDIPNFKILIYGKGNEIERLKERAKKMDLDKRFVFKGFVDKKYIASIVSRSDVNLMHWERTSVNNYGYDYNKLFDYLAAGKIVFSTIQSGFSLLVEKNCGIESTGRSPKEIAEGLREIYNMSEEEREAWGKRARIVSADYDFEVHTRKLEQIMESVVLERNETK